MAGLMATKITNDQELMGELIRRYDQAATMARRASKRTLITGSEARAGAYLDAIVALDTKMYLEVTKEVADTRNRDGKEVVAEWQAQGVGVHAC